MGNIVVTLDYTTGDPTIDIPGARRLAVGSLVGSASYASGGETLPTAIPPGLPSTASATVAGAFGLNKLESLTLGVGASTALILFGVPVDATPAVNFSAPVKIKMFTATATEAGAVDVSAAKFRFVAVGT